MKKFSLKGGLHFPSILFPDIKHNLNIAPLPHKVKIPLVQKDGFLGKPCVQIGDKVSEGDVIANDGNFCFHASISGKITNIDTFLFESFYGKDPVPFIEISFGGKLKSWNLKDISIESFSKQSLKSLLLSKGVVNLSAKPYLTLSDILNQDDVEDLVINGLDIGPDVSIERTLFTHKSDILFKALELIHAVLSPKRVWIVVPEKFKGKKLPFSWAHTVPMKDLFPQFHESLLIQTLLKKKVRDKEDLLKEKIAIFNWSTLYAVYQAVFLDKPLIERGITFGGQIVENKGNYISKIGTSVESLIEDFGVFDTPYKATTNSFINAVVYPNLELPLVKETSNMTLFNKDQLNLNLEEESCVECGVCETHCPKSLVPNELLLRENSKNSYKDCIFCGICEYVCPANIPLLDYFEKHMNDKKEVL